MGCAAGPVLTIERSADDAVAVPPLPVLSALLPLFGSGSVADTVAVLSNAPAALIVAVTLMVTLAPEARVGRKRGGWGKRAELGWRRIIKKRRSGAAA